MKNLTKTTIAISLLSTLALSTAEAGEFYPGDSITLRGDQFGTPRFFSAEDNGDLEFSRIRTGDTTTFEIHREGGGSGPLKYGDRIGFQNVNGTYITAMHAGENHNAVARATHLYDWEYFTIVDTNGNTPNVTINESTPFALKGAHNLMLSGQQNGTALASAAQIYGWEIIHMEHDTYVSAPRLDVRNLFSPHNVSLCEVYKNAPQTSACKGEGGYLAAGEYVKNGNALLQCREGEKDQWGHTVTWVADVADVLNTCSTICDTFKSAPPTRTCEGEGGNLTAGEYVKNGNALWQCRDGEKDQWGHTVTWAADIEPLQDICPAFEYVADLHLTEDACQLGYEPVKAAPGVSLNGNLKQGAYEMALYEDSFLCQKKVVDQLSEGVYPISHVSIAGGGSAVRKRNDDGSLAAFDTSDVNRGITRKGGWGYTFGAIIGNPKPLPMYLYMNKDANQGAIQHFHLRDEVCPSNEVSVALTGEYNGDLNQGAGGADIYLCGIPAQEMPF